MRHINELRNGLKEVIQENQGNKKLIKAVMEEFESHNIIGGEAYKILNGIINIDDIDRDVIYYVAKSIYNEYGDHRVDFHQFYTDKEIIKLNNEKFYVQNKYDDIFPITFENAQKVDDGYYHVMLSIKKWVDMYNKKVIDYDYRTQRNAKIVNIGGVKRKTPTLNKKQVVEIKESLLDGTYHPDSMRINFELGSSDEGDEMYYDEKNNKLIINGGEGSVLDGFHRLNAMIEALSENPNLDIKFPTYIYNYTVNKAKKVFSQINKGMKMDHSELRSLSEEKYSDRVVTTLMSTPDFSGKISRSNDVNHSVGQVVSFFTLSEAIDWQYGKELNNNRDVKKVSSYLSSFFEALFYHYNDLFNGDVKKVFETNYMVHDRMFYGYIALAKRMEDNNIDVDKVKDILDQVNFSSDNKLWKDRGIVRYYKGIVWIKAKQRIIRFFNGLDLEKIK